MNKIWHCCVSNFQKWTRNPRIYITFLLFYAAVVDHISGFNEAADLLGVKNTPWFFPFLSSQQFQGVYILLGFVLLFCDAPFTDRHQPYIIIRTGKRKWMAGQVLYIILASFLFVLSQQVFIVLSLLPTISFTTEWGSLLYTVSQTSIDGFLPRVTIAFSVIDSYSAVEATALSFLLVWLEGILIGMLMFLLNLQFKRIVGTCVGCFYAFSYFMIKNLIVAIPLLWKAVPSVWIDFVTLAGGAYNRHPGLVPALVGLLAWIAVLFGILMWKSRRQPIEIVKEI